MREGRGREGRGGERERAEREERCIKFLFFLDKEFHEVTGDKVGVSSVAEKCV